MRTATYRTSEFTTRSIPHISVPDRPFATLRSSGIAPFGNPDPSRERVPMHALLALLLAVAPAPMPADPVIPQGVVVDADDKPLAGVEILLSAEGPSEPDGSLPIISRTTSDAEGRFRLAVPPASAFKAG